MSERLMTEAEVADYYDRTRDLSEFDLDNPVMVPAETERMRTTRSSVMSVRFYPGEISSLQEEAKRRGVKVSDLVRTAALQELKPPEYEKGIQTAMANIESTSHQFSQAVLEAAEVLAALAQRAGKE